MLRLAISTFIFAALCQIAVCDINCFLAKNFDDLEKLGVKIRGMTGFNRDRCRPAREYLEATGAHAKQCNAKNIDVTRGLAFVRELCTVGWDLNNRYLDQEVCFMRHMSEAQTCSVKLWLSDDKPLPNFEEISLHVLKPVLKDILCKNFEKVYSCFNEKLGKPCGSEGLALTTKLTTAMSSYTTGLCAEVGGASTISALSWSVLLGILAIVFTWHKY